MLTGIDDLSLDTSTQVLRFEDLCHARGWTRDQWAPVGFHERAVSPPWEDPVTLATSAARPVVADDPDAFGLLLVATETALDFGKPLSSWVRGTLGLPRSCRNLEVKHACYGGTGALQLARAWVASPEAGGRKALVVTVDLARRHFGALPELTAGSGAVAFSVARDPALVAFDGPSGVATHDVHDVSRPGALTEIADPVLSLSSYLDLVEFAWEDWTVRSGLDRLEADHLVFHAPLVSLVRQAHAALLGAQDGIFDADRLAPDFDARVGPSLALNLRTANLYSGAAYASLASLILGGRTGRLGLFSYGSGACAEWLTGEILPGAKARLARHDLVGRLDAREQVDVATYEARVREGEQTLVAPYLTPPRDAHFARCWEGTGRLFLERVSGHVRAYGTA